MITSQKKKNVIIKNKKDVDINLQKIVKNNDLNVSIIFYGNVAALGEEIDQEEIKNNIFTNLKNQYLMNDLVEQKVYQLYISDKIGMISYMGFETFSDNMGYNEYPVKFETIELPETSRFSFFSIRSNTNFSQNLDLNSSTSSNHR